MQKLLGLMLGVSLLAVPFISSANSTVTASAGTGASISPSGSVVVPTGVVQSFSFGALSGFTLLGVSFDGTNQGAITSLNFTGDLSNHTLDVSAVSQGSLMPFCSGPMAPGWQMGVIGGGCGGTQVVLKAGAVGCPFWFTDGCILPR